MGLKKNGLSLVLPLILVAVILLFGTRSAGQEQMEPASSDTRPHYRISVLTFEPGKDLFSAFGHTAIVVRYMASGQSKVYNFGTFDFRRKDATWRYIKGDLNYWLSVSTLSSTLKRYRNFGRGALIQRLDLNPDRARWLAKTLEAETHPSRRHYQYRHFENNCCIRVRDLIDQATGGKLRSTFEQENTRGSYRQWTRSLMADHLFYRVAVDFVLGPAGDRDLTRFEEQFLPRVFSEDLALVSLSEPRRPLVVDTQRLDPTGRGTTADAHPVVLTVLVGLAVLFVFGVAIPVALGHGVLSRRLLGMSLFVWALFAGALGLLLVFLQTTSHFCTHDNENHVLVPLTHLWLVYPGFRLLFRADIPRKLQWTTTFYLGLSLSALFLYWIGKVCALFTQENARYFVPVLVVNLLLFLAMRRSFHRER